jgi:hypothetical protein
MALEPVAGSCPPPVGSHTVEVGVPAVPAGWLVPVAPAGWLVVVVPAGWKPWPGGRGVVVVVGSAPVPEGPARWGT